MKKETIKLIVAFVAGAGVGVGCTFKFMHDYFEKICDEEIESVKDIYRKQNKSHDEAMHGLDQRLKSAIAANREYKKILKGYGYDVIEVDEFEENLSEEEKEYIEEDEKQVEVLKKNIRENYRYDQISDSSYIEDVVEVMHPADTDEEEDEMYREGLRQTMENAKNRGKKPYNISYKEFANEKPEYDKQSISYYMEDETLVDENDDPIDDVSGCVGDCILEYDGSEDVIYVRNDSRAVDYEIICSEGSYSDYIGHSSGDFAD